MNNTKHVQYIFRINNSGLNKWINKNNIGLERISIKNLRVSTILCWNSEMVNAYIPIILLPPRCEYVRCNYVWVYKPQNAKYDIFSILL